jgi:multicomponent Na+:H+ antiporter subunit A
MSASVLMLGLGFAAAPLAAALPGRFVALFGALVAAIMLGLAASLVPLVSQGGIEAAAFWGSAALGIGGGLRVDGLSLVFLLLITGIGSLIFLYAHAYAKGDPRLVRLVVVLVLFMSAMVGAVAADDVIVLFVFWELTSLTSFFLVGFDHEKLKARKAALQALLVTGGGGLALLAGLILVAMAAGTTSLSGIIAAKGEVLAHPAATPAMLLIILGAFTKSAQVPFHFWLPNAMAAPTPVSAYLHSATMVKLGVYLLARFNPVYQGEELWQGLLAGFGIATAATAAVLAFRETDLKRVLAYTTVTALGTLVMLIGIAPELSATAAVTFLIVHALYKAALFMIAGIVDHEAGTRDVSTLGGLARHMPLTAAAAVLAAFSMAGLPPFVGFVAKELIYEAKLELGMAASLLLAIGFLVNAATVAIAGVVSLRLFFSAPRATPEKPHDPPLAMYAGPFVLATLGLLVGAMPAGLGAGFVDAAVTSILGRPADVTLKLWHGFNLVLALSALTVVCGVAIYLAWERIVPRLRAIRLIDEISPSAAYERGLASLIETAEACTRAIQHGSLRGYVRLIFAVTAVATLLTLAFRGGFAWPDQASLADPRLFTVVLMLVGAVAVMAARTAIAAVLALGLVGFATALVFLVAGAPDVAFTQFAVETLMVVILATALMRLPLRGRDRREPREKAADLGVALVCGVSVAAVLAAVLAGPFDPRLSEWFGAQSVPAAHGRNVVNVILVDFRALDTLGEITVLAIAAFAVVALLRRARTADGPEATR